MMLTEELVPNRRLTRIYPRANLITFEKYHKHSVKSESANKDLEIVKELIDEFRQQTSINSLSKTLTANMQLLQRLFWIMAFLCALGLMICVIQILSTRYKKHQFKTVINDTEYPIYRIDFPEVLICNQNRLNWARFATAKNNYLRPEHHNTELEQLFTKVISLYDTFHYGTFDRFQNLNSTFLHVLDYINFTIVAQFMSWRCDEFLSDCVWRHRAMNCCDIFIARRSTFGFCWSFNTLETAEGKLKQQLDNKWPWRATNKGPGNGLNVRVRINEELHSPFSTNKKGLMLMVMEPGVWWSYTNSVAVSDQISVRLNAQLSFYDSTTRRIASNVRECVFDHERNSMDFKTLLNHKYMFENCQAECIQEHSMKYCNCSMDLFFPPSQYPSCKLSDLPCLAKNSKNLQHFEQSGERDVLPYDNKDVGMVCECFLNCLSLSYLVDLRSTDLPQIIQNPNNTHIDMDFHFNRDTIVVYRTTVIYTWVDLLVNFGNATALFLGCSLISVAELIYYFCIYMPQRLRRAHHKAKNPINYDSKLFETWISQLYRKNDSNINRRTDFSMEQRIF